MNVFADSNYWVATINERDRYYSAAQVARASLGDVILVTTDEILVEVLNYFADRGEHLRRFASESVARVQENPNVEVLPQTRESLRKGIGLYCSRADKEYSLTDCISMNAMRDATITKILMNDHHFQQEGFEVLIPNP